MKTSSLSKTLYEELAPIFRSAWIAKEVTPSYNSLENRFSKHTQVDEQLKQQDEQDILSIRSELSW